VPSISVTVVIHVVREACSAALIYDSIELGDELRAEAIKFVEDHPARPGGQLEFPRGHAQSVMLNAPEQATIRAWAKKEGVSIGEFFRTAAFKYIEQKSSLGREA
jgi:hypothetical protein